MGLPFTSVMMPLKFTSVGTMLACCPNAARVSSDMRRARRRNQGLRERTELLELRMLILLLEARHTGPRVPDAEPEVKGLSHDDFLTREVLVYQLITTTDNQGGGVLCYTRCPNRGASRHITPWRLRSNPGGFIGSVCLKRTPTAGNCCGGVPVSNCKTSHFGYCSFSCDMRERWFPAISCGNGSGPPIPT